METLLAYITWDASPRSLRSITLTLRWYGISSLWASSWYASSAPCSGRKKNPKNGWTRFYLYRSRRRRGRRLSMYSSTIGNTIPNTSLRFPRVWKRGLASHGGAIGIIIAPWIFSARTAKRSGALDPGPGGGAHRLVNGCFIRLGNPHEFGDRRHAFRRPLGLPVFRPGLPSRTGDEPATRCNCTNPSVTCSPFSSVLVYWKTSAEGKAGAHVWAVPGAGLGVIRFGLEYFQDQPGGFETEFGDALSTGQLLVSPSFWWGLYFYFPVGN